ncbi:hypothetical protein DM02DRAFT_676246 [Periconia macrospinosa]|uniref:Intramembrane protease 2 n=1 Tax=Periconia macrospinosa TaxID=97972 RepID=A0A2V1D8D9_9PLEO|nr:hypothetical protein DM02DRAFT_676246 [Periconia macrospinosa]
MDGADLWARAAHVCSEVRPFIPTYAHLLLSALFPIYAGAHASLTRPSSAAKPTKKERRRKRRSRKSDKSSLEDESSSESESDTEEEDEDEEHKMEGLAPTDAIMMPLFAGMTLAGLYFLIKWLEDPALLNKLLNWYFALFGVFSVSRLITDALDIGHSLVFPHRYALGGTLYHVVQKEKAALPVSGEGKDPISSPLPGFLARIPLSAGFRKFLWSDRAMPGKKWSVRLYIHQMFSGKLLIGAQGMVGAITAIMVVAYFNFVDKPWYLTNLMGFGFSYGALQLMSPTTFATGSLILGALFFYDIYFVFYTPMMVTVAKSLDVPIKLVFPRPPPADDPTAKAGHAMLGLGDVVLPGIMIGLALRFDLFLFYLRRQKRKQTPSSHNGSAALGDITIEKPKYFSLAGRWSDHFWTHSILTGRPLFKAASPSENKETAKAEAPFTFPKTYFKASLIGYVAGMLCTLGVMHVWGHAQPALLYLVPGVLGSLWLTALARGELALMWDFSEAIEEEEEQNQDQNNTKTGEDVPEAGKSKSQRSSFFSLSDAKAQQREDRALKALSRHVHVDDDDDASGSDNENGDAVMTGTSSTSKRSNTKARRLPPSSSREVFSLSISAPWKVKTSKSAKSTKETMDAKEKEKEKVKPNWAPSELEAPKSVGRETIEPSGKRVRLRK